MRRLLTICGVWLGAACAVPAGNGAGELSLDRAAVSALIGALLPYEETIDLPDGGSRRLTVERVTQLSFVEGGIEARVALRLDSPEVAGVIDLRYEPRLERTTGELRLVATRARPVAPLRLDVDLSPWLPPLDLTRRLDWSDPFPVTLFIQSAHITEDRLELNLALVTRGTFP